MSLLSKFLFRSGKSRIVKLGNARKLTLGPSPNGGLRDHAYNRYTPIYET